MWKGLGEAWIATRSLEKALTTSWKEHGRVLTGWIEYELGNFSYNQL